MLGRGPVFEGGGRAAKGFSQEGWNQGYADMESGAVLFRGWQEFR